MSVSSFLKVKLSSRLFWVVAALVLSVASVETVVRYDETRDVIESRAYTRAKTLQDYFVSMRFVYHQQFLKSGIDLNDSTVGFLPAHASALISEEFAKRSLQGITIRNVSDKPRNIKNQADDLEIEKIRFFSSRSDTNESFSRISQNGQEYFFFAAPLRIQPYCLSCHGEKEQTLPYIRSRYDSAYGYKVGEVRGLTSIKIPISAVSDQMMSMFWQSTLFTIALTAALLGFLYVALRKIVKREEQINDELSKQVEEKTVELREAYETEMHLSSILRTVADVNQLLITTRDIDELLDKTAKTISSNETFATVKISLAVDGELVVRASCGVLEEFVVTEIEQRVYESNKSVMLGDLTADSVPEECKQKARTYGLKSTYSIPLKSSIFEEDAVGVITVCTKTEGGFDGREKDMLDELAGDIGFAVKSFTQTKTIEGLHRDKENNYKNFIDALVDMIEQRDTYTAGHTKRVAEYSVMIAREMGLAEDEISTLAEAAKLHDIGKVVTPDSVLLKPGALSKFEYELIKEHVVAGYQVLSNIGSYEDLAQIMVHHHERYDGSGYPYGKSADEIPLLGHILAVADSFDAMITNRIYKPRKSIEQAIAELKTLSGSWYHPLVVDAAVKVLLGVTVEDVTDQAIGTSDIDRERLSYFFRDRLTKLYNEDYLTLVLLGRSEHKVPKYLTSVSLSNFTHYNKEHTWEGGNMLLAEFSEYLSKSVQDKLIFRVWGDHFLIADCDCDIESIMRFSPLTAKGVGHKIRELRPPFEDMKEILLNS